MTEEGIRTKIDRQTEQFYSHSRNTRYRNRVRQAITDPQFIGLSASNLLDDRFIYHLIFYITKLHQLGLNNRFTSAFTRDQLRYLWRECVPKTFTDHVHDVANIPLYASTGIKINDIRAVHKRLIEGYCAYPMLFAELKQKIIDNYVDIRIILLVTNNALCFGNTQTGQIQWKEFERKVTKFKQNCRIMAEQQQYHQHQLHQQQQLTINKPAANRPPLPPHHHSSQTDEETAKQMQNFMQFMKAGAKRKRYSYVVNENEPEEHREPLTEMIVEQKPKSKRKRARNTKTVV